MKCPFCRSTNIVVWKEGSENKMICNTCGYRGIAPQEPYTDEEKKTPNEKFYSK